MKKNRIFDILWLIGVVCFVFLLMTKFFIDFSSKHSYLAAFVKFALLAPMGELLVIRLTSKEWSLPKGFVFKVIVWGLFGMAIGLSFKVFGAGVNGLLADVSLGGATALITAFLTSAFMNMTFGPVMMGSHKVSDKFIDMKLDKNNKKVTIRDAVKAVDWYGFITFVVFKTVPFFWIPAHTIVFLLPGEYRLIVAALLSIALGILLTFTNKKTKTAK